MEQARQVDAGRVFRVCDQIADMEDKLRYVLSVRTLIEMSLIRASRIATTATIEELMKAVEELRANPSSAAVRIAAQVPPPAPAPVPEPSAVAPRPEPVAANRPSPEKTKPRPDVELSRRKDILDDPKLNSILSSIPGATIVDIKEPRK